MHQNISFLCFQIGLVMMFIGNAIYITLQQFEPILPARYLLLAARLIIGIGSGNSSLLRSYASTASTAHDRSKAIAYVTCGQAIGQVAGPGLCFYIFWLSETNYVYFLPESSNIQKNSWFAWFKIFIHLYLSYCFIRIVKFSSKNSYNFVKNI